MDRDSVDTLLQTERFDNEIIDILKPEHSLQLNVEHQESILPDVTSLKQTYQITFIFDEYEIIVTRYAAIFQLNTIYKIVQ